MHKGFIQLGNLIFIVLSVVMVFAAGYLYFFSDREKNITNVASANIEQGTQIKFTHPIYQYSLSLPYGWKGKYQVTESENQTNFWYVGDSQRRDLLFTIKRQSVEELVALEEEGKRLGQADGFLYLFIIPSVGSKPLSPVYSQMKKDLLTIEKGFSLSNKNESDLKIFKILSDNLANNSSSDLKFLAFEIIATQENSSTTEYFIWFSRRSFSWDEFRLRDWTVESMPAVISIAKNNKMISFKVPRKGANFGSDVKKLFPESVRTSMIFSSKSADHLSLIDKLSNRIDEAVNLYFGGEPVIVRAGVIQEIKPGQGGLNLKVFLAESVVLSASSTYSISNINKTMSELFVPSSTPALNLPATFVKNKAGIIVSSSSPQIVSLPEWSIIWSKTSTSTWRKKPFWFEILDGQILRVYPVN